MPSLVGTLQTILNFHQENQLSENLSTTEFNLMVNKTLTFSGSQVPDTGVNQIWGSKNRVLTSSSFEDISMYNFATVDLSTGAGRGPLGTEMGIYKLLLLAVFVDEASVGTLKVGGDAGAGETWFEWCGTRAVDDLDHVVRVLPGGMFLIAAPVGTGAGYGVGSGLALDAKLRFTADGGSVTYSVYVVGRDNLPG